MFNTSHLCTDFQKAHLDFTAVFVNTENSKQFKAENYYKFNANYFQTSLVFSFFKGKMCALLQNIEPNSAACKGNILKSHNTYLKDSHIQQV